MRDFPRGTLFRKNVQLLNTCPGVNFFRVFDRGTVFYF